MMDNFLLVIVGGAGVLVGFISCILFLDGFYRHGIDAGLSINMARKSARKSVLKIGIFLFAIQMLSMVVLLWFISTY